MYSYDGTKMLQLIVMSINPSIRVCISDLKSDIQNSLLVQNIVDLCNKMTGYYLLIVKSNGHHEDMVLYTYSALLSRKNNMFNNYVQRGKDDWELGAEKMLRM